MLVYRVSPGSSIVATVCWNCLSYHPTAPHQRHVDQTTTNSQQPQLGPKCRDTAHCHCTSIAIRTSASLPPNTPDWDAGACTHAVVTEPQEDVIQQPKERGEHAKHTGVQKSYLSGARLPQEDDLTRWTTQHAFPPNTPDWHAGECAQATVTEPQEVDIRRRETTRWAKKKEGRRKGRTRTNRHQRDEQNGKRNRRGEQSERAMQVNKEGTQ